MNEISLLCKDDVIKIETIPNREPSGLAAVLVSHGLLQFKLLENTNARLLG